MLTISDLVNYILCLHVQIRLGFYFVNNIMTFKQNALEKTNKHTTNDNANRVSGKRKCIQTNCKQFIRLTTGLCCPVLTKY